MEEWRIMEERERSSGRMGIMEERGRRGGKCGENEWKRKEWWKNG